MRIIFLATAVVFLHCSSKHVSHDVTVVAFAPSPLFTHHKFSNAPRQTDSTSTSLRAKPRRLKENVDGVVYVNDKCINCAACSGFAPRTFRRSDEAMAHVVYQQPSLINQDELQEARQALAACPVAAIRIETLAERRHAAPTDEAKRAVEQRWTKDDDELAKKMALKQKDDDKEIQPLFPRPFLDDLNDVHWLGHHNDESFGAIPYLLRSTLDEITVWIMVDTPRFSRSSRETVETLTGPSGPDYLFLTHVDDTADHGKWASSYANMKRIFHAGDLGRHNWLGDLTLEEVEVLLHESPQKEHDGAGLTAYRLNGDVLPGDWMESTSDETVILHTPGHSPGSITLFRRPSSADSGDGGDVDKVGILFTGDTYAWTSRGEGHMSGFPRYGNNLRRQADTLELLLDLDWLVVAPGHGHPRDYRDSVQNHELREKELRGAQEELRTW